MFHKFSSDKDYSPREMGKKFQKLQTMPGTRYLQNVNTKFQEKIKKFSSIGGYKKPELVEDSVKLDSNENYVIPKQFQSDIISSAKKISDIREYPLGGVERLIDALSKFVKIPSSMIGVGNGSDQILDLILSNFAS